MKNQAQRIKAAEKHINKFKTATEKQMKILSNIRSKKNFDFFTAINDNADSFYNTSVLKAVGADGNRKTMYLCDINNQEGLLTFLEMYADILGIYGFAVTRCEVCGRLMITKISKPSYTCTRTVCKKKYHNKVNSACRRKTYTNPIEKTYLAFTGACRTYRKKLLGSDIATNIYDKKYYEVRKIVLAKKNALPKIANSEVIESFELFCQKERDQLKEFSDGMKMNLSS
jgi:hypothetical protein